MLCHRVTIFVFVTGTVLVVGARTRTEVLKAFDNFYPVLCMFKKPNITTQSSTAETVSVSETIPLPGESLESRVLELDE